MSDNLQVNAQALLEVWETIERDSGGDTEKAAIRVAADLIRLLTQGDTKALGFTFSLLSGEQLKERGLERRREGGNVTALEIVIQHD
ncbi:hypothetical protein [Deinococcus sp. LM3]|uniref:hypothetical protein n=1 Tax=Deinococcus sp. LM3 TaxID=1938608 RepID=UPI00099488A0|nr:hypothetical protein [Deinococcus sp. LM3]OOV15238.1 hypothetical protein BXU09_11845 [Deinococcus sp. LM3]